MTSAVVCEGLTKRFGETLAVDDFSIEVAEGEVLALLGPSGCGKTTFLRLLAGFERPDSGRILVAGREVAGRSGFVAPEHRRIAIVPQDYALFPHMTVAQNTGYGLARAERRDGGRVREVLGLVGLSGLGGRYPHELSGGQQQRVALARALAPRPRTILMDEPFSNLDAALRERVRSEVGEILAEADVTVVFVTHDQEEALSLAHRVAVMNRGRLHQVDPPERVYTHPADAFVGAFVGRANVLEATSDGHAVTCALGVLRPAVSPPAGRAVAIVRPESLRLHQDPDGTATVQRSTFQGHAQLVDVALGDGTRVRSRVGPGHLLEAGDRVSVLVVADEVVAFATDADVKVP